MIKNAKNKAVKKTSTKVLTPEVKEIEAELVVEKVEVKPVAPVKAPQRPQYVQCWSCGKTVAIKQLCDNCGKPLGGIA